MQVFAVWMKVMAQNKKTKLWLLNFSKAAYKYLRKEAERRKVDHTRHTLSPQFPLLCSSSYRVFYYGCWPGRR